MIGNKFNALTVIGPSEPVHGLKMWECKCECGKLVKVSESALFNNRAISCGCINRKIYLLTKYNHLARKSLGHQRYAFGLKNKKVSKIKRLWHAMMERCYLDTCDTYVYYGGSGIDVCDEWRKNIDSFVSFCLNNGHKEGLEIDRIDNTKGYSPDNCRFVNRSKNLANTRRSRRYVIHGVIFETITMAASLIGITPYMVNAKLKKETAEYFSYRLYGKNGKKRGKEYARKKYFRLKASPLKGDRDALVNALGLTKVFEE